MEASEVLINASLAILLFAFSWWHVTSKQKAAQESMDWGSSEVRGAKKEKATAKIIARPQDNTTTKRVETVAPETHSSSNFGATREEREELAQLLHELSPSEQKAMLASWDTIPQDDLLSSADPSAETLEKKLKEHRQEMAALMHSAAYDELDSKAEAALVSRMRELKELVELEAELLQMTATESALNSKINKEPAITPNTAQQKSELKCQPCN
mmetsp:Transcript_39327/g.79429  ORF Transcript_39327/g.79429 Transcript_39327/m.79429 type:complete len:214 (+) Transcript_39327:135-776(+)|eukprot:CAMPEP_0171708246 /NCGR_PEP_ID=MMETSP0991-20121206/14832_1 /TAXON_ID=483369 /ORGANISM="non described non described, Strain CCMP2098" /LENGTH=213 /DNA_ID=CAMNT_0012298253 /DNA_START=63 /DNA_END=704 /DNA_ORIENTATION=-